MNYKITLMGCPLWVRLLRLEGAQADICMQFDDMEALWEETEENLGEYDVETELLSCDDRLEITVEDSNGNVVFNTNDLDDITQYPYEDDDCNEICPEGYEFKGVEDGNYLVNQTKMKGAFWEATIEIDSDFDSSRLYLIQDETFNDEFRTEHCFPMGVLYYQKGESINPETDRIEMDFDSDNGSYGYSVSIASVKEKDWWTILKEG